VKSLLTIREGGAAHWAIRIAAAVLVVGVLFLVPTKGGNGLITSSTEALTLMCAAMALNLLLGYTGQISIGHSAFYGIGAYTTGICVSRWGWSPWVTFPLAFLVAFVVGVIVSFPASRIKGVYLALVTLALALVFPNFLRWPKIAGLTGGGAGLPNEDSQVQTTGFDIGRKEGQMRHFEIFGWDPFGDLRSLDAKTAFYYWIAAVATIVVYLVCRGVVKSRAGRAMVAVRDNETAAAVMGVNVVATKAFVFGISAGLCAVPGSVTAIRIGSVSPDIASLTIIGSISFLIVMVVGGAGSLWGPIIGATLFVFVSDKTGTWANDDAIPALLRPFFAWSKTPPGGGIFALLLIALMFVAPRGIVGVWRQYSPRLVRVLPRPVGMAAPEALVRESGAGADGADTSNTSNTNITST
jgi:branched-chain amino acid transport system permease protein